jgi:hypothetical protein
LTGENERKEKWWEALRRSKPLHQHNANYRLGFDTWTMRSLEQGLEQPVYLLSYKRTVNDDDVLYSSKQSKREID